MSKAIFTKNNTTRIIINNKFISENCTLSSDLEYYMKKQL
jgi:hypothetical protein